MRLRPFLFPFLFFSLLILSIFLIPLDLDATPEYAERTGKTCALCHDGANGGPLTVAGKAFIRNGYEYPIPERILDKTLLIESSLHRTIRGILGIIHLITAAIFVGTIFFVHLFLKPRSLTGGIPGGEKKLGLTCMSILAATGIYLTWYRLDTAASFFESHFGVLLFIKIILFIILVTLGVLAVTFINKRMRREADLGAGDTAGQDFDIKQLPYYDGKEGRPAYILYENKVYDVTESMKWKGGSHFTQHAAGKDLTRDMENAPHSEDVLSRYPVVATLSEQEKEQGPQPIGIAQRIFPVMAYINLGLVMLILVCVGVWLFDFPRFSVGADEVSYGEDIELPAGGAEDLPLSGAVAGYSPLEKNCIACHTREKPALVTDWQRSIHARLGVSCADCHKVTGESEVWVSETHFDHSEVPVTPLVTPTTCARCHQEEVDQYARSKHAHTLEIINEIDMWLIHGMNNETERSTGCFACHGSEVKIENGKPVKGTWPNVGVGRLNPDGSRGSCTSCHTRHRFSVEEARKPEACDQCHLGPDHPQIEIYNESKHGTMYHAYGDDWTWRPEDFRWTAGRDYRAPTCAACHMSQAGNVETSHDVTERLSWELQAPLTIRPSEFTPYPAKTDWKVEREKMRTVCLQCHSEAWTDGHFENMDAVISLYNTEYYTPIKNIMDGLYQKGLLTQDSYFDEELEWEFYELWHHEGRRARMGAAMMAPDYAWWHGFYECKHRFVHILTIVEELGRDDKGEWGEEFPGKLKTR